MKNYILSYSARGDFIKKIYVSERDDSFICWKYDGDLSRCFCDRVYAKVGYDIVVISRDNSIRTVSFSSTLPRYQSFKRISEIFFVRRDKIETFIFGIGGIPCKNSETGESDKFGCNISISYNIFQSERFIRQFSEYETTYLKITERLRKDLKEPLKNILSKPLLNKDSNLISQRLYDNEDEISSVLNTYGLQLKTLVLNNII